MKRIIVIALCGITCAGMAFAQAESINVFSDLGATDCFFTDTGGLVQVYVFHMNSPATTASEWMIYTPGWTYLGEQADFELVIGNSISGVAISYGDCLNGNFKLMTINFFGSNANNCLLLGIVPSPTKAGVRTVDCSSNSFFISGGWGRINADATCQDCNPPDPVEQSTWGQIKSLYN